MEIENYIEKIKQIDTLNDSKFKYNTERWKFLNEDLKHSILDFEDTEISRNDIINAFRDYFAGHIEFKRPFALTMIWGYADTGYGTYRTNKYYESELNQNLVKSSFKSIQNNNLRKAYKELLKIKGLNISYISKLMYFATKARSIKDYFLIFDMRVARSIIKLSCPKEVYDLVQITPSKKYEDYKKYNELVHYISRKHNIEAEAIEMFLFNQEF